MAQTKQSARKNASPCTPPSSSSSYESVECSPSPPPRPTPPHTSSASPPSNTSQEILNLIPLSTFLPSLYTRPTPNFAQVPPHLRTQNTHPLRSMRVQSGIGTSKPLNPKPHYFIISDSKSDDSSDSCSPSAKPLTQPEPSTNTLIKTTPLATTPPPQHPSSTSAQAPSNTKPSTPSKSTLSFELSQSTPPHQKRRSINDIVTPPTKQNEPLSQPKPQTKIMKTKITMSIAQYLAQSSPHPQPSPQTHTKHSPSPQSSSPSTSSASESSPPSKKPKQTTPPLISPEKSKLFKEKWAQRPVEIGRVFVFDNLVVDDNVVQHHTDALGWTSFLKISESYYPDVVRAFYCNAKTFADKSLIISTIKGVEIKLTPNILASILQLPKEDPSVFGDH
uniref:Proline-rich receptor-like protein kinase PERK9 n=1 Tax=Cicer arietinum TaxID=3827 RepID=A0A1S3EFU0_CICAR|nr:proline-rich receptor-like protein kinase PERK9 [Cicer arietinum]